MEILPHFNLEGQRIGDINRDEYYAGVRQQWGEQRTVSSAIACSWLLLVHPEKGLLLQKRSLDKKINPGLWDITINGHMHADETPEEACLRECREELSIQAHIVPREELEAYRKEQSVEQQAYITPLGMQLWWMQKEYVGIGSICLPGMVGAFFGYYSGPWHFADGEVSDARFFQVEEFRAAVAREPEAFVPEAKLIEDIWARGSAGQ